MALALLEKVGEESLEQPSQTIVISPWLDVTMENPKIEQVQPNDLMLSQDLLKLAGIAYAGSEKQVKNYLVSPIYGPLEKLENVTIYTGTNDILNPDVHKLVEMAQEKRNNYWSKRNTRSSTWLDFISIYKSTICKQVSTRSLPIVNSAITGIGIFEKRFFQRLKNLTNREKNAIINLIFT